MNVPLRNRDCRMPHQPHYSERIRPRLSQARPESMPQRMQHEVGWHFQKRPHARMLLSEMAVRPWRSIHAVKDVPLRRWPVVREHFHDPLAEAGLVHALIGLRVPDAQRATAFEDLHSQQTVNVTFDAKTNEPLPL